jgi:hypothetical protein
MTEIEAHQFIERCRRKMYPWRAKTEAQAAFGMQKFSLGLSLGMFISIMIQISEDKKFDVHYEWAFVAFLVSIFGFFFWLTSKLLRARQILGYSQFPNQKS